MKVRFSLLTPLLLIAPMMIAIAFAAEDAASDTQAADAKHGEQIFKSICAHCHRTDHEVSAVGAPGLMDVTERHDDAWLSEWLQGPETFSKKDDTAKALVESNPYGLIMPTYPEMQDAKNRSDVIAFLKTLRSK